MQQNSVTDKNIKTSKHLASFIFQTRFTAVHSMLVILRSSCQVVRTLRKSWEWLVHFAMISQFAISFNKYSRLVKYN